jgi:cell division cycle protein 20 (cofactor of APC complex)
MNRDVAHYNLVAIPTEEDSLIPCSEAEQESQYKNTLAKSLFGEDSGNVEEHKILALKNKAPAPNPAYQNRLKVLYSQNLSSHKRSTVNVSSDSYMTLDAPGTSDLTAVLTATGIVDDYYLNLLDWSQGNTLAIALSSCIYLNDISTAQPELLHDFGDDLVTSINYSPTNSQYLAVGLDSSVVQLWDTTRGAPIRKLEGHQGRVGALSWNGFILSTGSYDSTIKNWDVRSRNPLVSTYSGHSGEVCGLRWSLDGKQLASGGNDNILNIWQQDQDVPRFSFEEHQAAVKAVAWCPWQPSLLASGGGTADRSIKFWNTQTGQLLNSIDTESQVCALQWSVHRKELISSHGFSKNQICTWKYPTMTKTAEFTGHSARVLHLAQSPDGTRLVSASADETLRYWHIYDPVDDVKKGASAATAKPSASTRSIRSSMNKIR